MADLVFGMLISLYRNIIPCDRVCRQGGTKDGLVGVELEGRNSAWLGPGLLAFGWHGLPRPLDARYSAYSRTVKDVEGIRFVDLKTLLSECDIVSLHTPLNDGTRGLMNRERIGWMKKDAVLINTARGPVVIQRALAEALSEGRIGGACIDVFEKEPPVEKDHPLFFSAQHHRNPSCGLCHKGSAGEAGCDCI